MAGPVPALRHPDEPHKIVARRDRVCIGTRMARSAAAIHLARRHAGQTNMWPLGASDRSVAVPDGRRGTGECLAGRNDEGEQKHDEHGVALGRVGVRSNCAAPDYLDQAGPLADLDDLDAHESIIGTSSTWSFIHSGGKILYRPQGRFRCNSGHAVVDACLAGMGVCQLPEFYIVPFIRSGRLRLVLDDFRPQTEPIWAVYPQRRHLLPKISRAIEHIRMELTAGMAIDPL